MKSVKYVVLTFVIVGALASGMPAIAADPASERGDGFKASKQAVSAIQDALENGNVVAVVEPATSMAVFAARIPGLFPVGSGGGFFAKARGEIWQNFADFEAKAKAFQTSAQSLADLSAAGGAELSQVVGAFGKVKEACKDCHSTYKAGW